MGWRPVSEYLSSFWSWNVVWSLLKMLKLRNVTMRPEVPLSVVFTYWEINLCQFRSFWNTTWMCAELALNSSHTHWVKTLQENGVDTFSGPWLSYHPVPPHQILCCVNFSSKTSRSIYRKCISRNAASSSAKLDSVYNVWWGQLYQKVNVALDAEIQSSNYLIAALLTVPWVVYYKTRKNRICLYQVQTFIMVNIQLIVTSLIQKPLEDL